jgi:hypothetical protein
VDMGVAVHGGGVVGDVGDVEPVDRAGLCPLLLPLSSVLSPVRGDTRFLTAISRELYVRKLRV